MENEKKTQYTEEGYRKLVDELQYLKDVRIPEIKVQIAEARAFGDLSENSEYDEAKNEQAKTVTRIAELEKLINEATIINESEIRADVVNLGSFVRVYDSDMDEEVEYNVVGSNEADPMQGRISDQSPLGSAMLGAKVRTHTPENKSGMFQGLRIVAQVLIPGIIGPAIGAKVLANADTIINDDGTTSFIPNANIFLVALIVLLFVWIVMIPLYKKEKNHAE